MSQLTVVVTGANRGIGLSFVKYYKQQGCKVIAGCRNPAQAKELNDLNVQVVPLDCEKDASILAFRDAIGDQPVHLLINNAGILDRDSVDSFTSESIERQLRVNSVAPMVISRAFLPNLKATQGHSKIALITSRMGSIADNGSGGYYGYRASKAALNAMGRSLSIDLKSHNISVGLIHPGYIQTGMTGYNGDMTPDDSVARMAQVIQGLTLENSGTFYHRDGTVLPW